MALALRFRYGAARPGDHLIATWVGHCLDHPDARHADRRNVHQGVRQDDLPHDQRGGCRSDRRHHADADHAVPTAQNHQHCDAGVDHHHRHADADHAVPTAQNHQHCDAGVDHHRHHASADGDRRRPVVHVEWRRRNGELRRPNRWTGGLTDDQTDDQTGDRTDGHHHGGDHRHHDRNEETNS